MLNEVKQIEEAADLHIQANDWDGLVRLILMEAGVLLAWGKHKTLVKALESIPETIIQSEPRLSFWFGHARIFYKPEESLSHFEKAYEKYKKLGNKTGMVVSIAGTINTIVQEGRDFRQLDSCLDLLDRLQCNDNDEDVPSHPLTCSIFMALVWRCPDHSDVDRWKKQTHQVYRESRNPMLRSFAGLALSLHCLWIGDLTQAAQMLDGLRGGRQPRSALPPLALIMHSLSEAVCGFLDSQFERTLQAVSEGLKTSKDTGAHLWKFHFIGLGAAAALSAGEPEKAKRFFAQMAGSLPSARKCDLIIYHMLAAWDALLREDYHTANRYQYHLESTLELGAVFPLAIGHYIMLQVSIEQGEFQKATEHLKHVSGTGLRMKSTILTFMSLLAEVQIALEQGQEAEVLRLLRKGLNLGKKKGYLNFWGWRPKVMARLCVVALAHGIEVDYTKTLIKKRHLLPDMRGPELEDWPWPVKVYTMGRFAIVINGKKLKVPRKAQQRPLALLKVLIALGGRDVPEEEISNTLWPETEGDKAHDVFSITLRRLRKLLGIKGAVHLQDRCLTLNQEYCWVDIWAFERFLNEAERASRVGEMEQAIKWFEKAERLNQGIFLSNDAQEPWTIKLRERIQYKFLRQIKDITDYLCQSRQCSVVMSYIHKGLEMDDLIEELYQLSMKCHQCLGRHAEALSTYNTLKKALSMTFGISPSPKTEAIYLSIKKGE